MANADSVGQFTLDSFGNGRIGVVKAASLATSGNAVVTIPLLGGGLTNAGAAAGSGAVIVRRVTVQNATGNVATANVAISVASDGNIAAANAVVANVVLSNLTGAGNDAQYFDLVSYVTATAKCDLSSGTGGSPAITHAGWVRRTVGTGGRAGRVFYETLVASGTTAAVSGDQSDDTEFADS